MKAKLTVPERPAIVHLLAILDVLVLLLIFFVLITNVAREAGVAVVNLPESENRLRQYGPKVVVTARGGAVPSIYVGLKRIQLEDLEETLKASAEDAGAETVLLLADRMLPVAVERRIIEVGRRLQLNVMLVGSWNSVEPFPEAPAPVLVPDPETNEKD
jgi:biopolymer transport protein ExbD